ncbi:RNA ligase-domain-containing protein [Pseudoneurospora amorphoporcata]|uniref:RNA ligase-domain-containing protein n=1 Tax=Pseudoneurospora amorphoporcata TaxID=241081 RepID=A0AAN6SFF8_9PEZI|nr:RNA ligase-domain-containing protein [Pseudoneurospora amorphoporcata]
MSDDRRAILRDNPGTATINASSGYLDNVRNLSVAANKENIPTGTGSSPTDKAASTPAATPSQPAPNNRKRKAPATPPAPQRLPKADELEDIIINQPMTDNCDQVRRKINRALDAGIITKTALAGEIGVSVKSLTGFLREHGAFKGQGYSSYPAAWEYFKKLEVFGYKIPNKTSAAKKRKTDSAAGAEAGAANSAGVDISDVHLEGEETDEVPVYDTCDEIRRKIDAYLKRPGVTMAQFCRDIHAQHQSAKRPANIHTSQLTRFRGMNGARAGATSSVFYGAYVFFEKLRIKEKKPMTKHRQDMEEAWPAGFDRTDDGRKSKGIAPPKLSDPMDNATPTTSSNAVQPIQQYQRKLVGVRKVTAKKKIEGHRTAVTVNNWTVVGQTSQMKRFKIGDLVVFMEIDSFIPKTDRFWELWPSMTDLFNGEQGLRVRSRAVAGTWSQGMIFPLEQFPEITTHYQKRIEKVGKDNATKELLSYSWADRLGIKKWEYPTHERPVTGIIGELSALIQKPGNWRIQDVGNVVFHPHTAKNRIYQVTEKLDGISMHVYKVSNSSTDLLSFFPALRPLPSADKPDGSIPIPPTMQTERSRVGVCNRSHEFFDDGKNIYWETAKASGILDKIHEIPFRNIAIQGELVGSHIQGNTMQYPEGKHEFVVFGIWDIDAKDYLATKTVELLCKTLDIAHVPVLGYGPVTKYGKNAEEILAFADRLGPGKYGGIKEGLIFRANDDWKTGFKVISNRWLKMTGK